MLRPDLLEDLEIRALERARKSVKGICRSKKMDFREYCGFLDTSLDQFKSFGFGESTKTTFIRTVSLLSPSVVELVLPLSGPVGDKNWRDNFAVLSSFLTT
jgi:hypothetical protein